MHVSSDPCPSKPPGCFLYLQVAGSRMKKREGAGAVDLQAECQGDGTEMQVGDLLRI